MALCQTLHCESLCFGFFFSFPLKCKHAKEGHALLSLQLGQLVGLRPQFVAYVQLKHRAQVDGVVPALIFGDVAVRGRALAHRPHPAHQGCIIPHGIGVTPDPVAERREAVSAAVRVAADDVERRLAVDKVEAGFGDDDLVVHELEVALGERLALIAHPLKQIVGFIVASCNRGKEIERKTLSNTFLSQTREYYSGKILQKTA